mgnify:CR=1 FL=1
MLQAFEKECRAALSKHSTPALLWYLAEAARLRADYHASQDMLTKCLAALKAETPADKRSAVFARIARDLTRLRYRPEAVMAAFNAAASLEEKTAVVRFEELVKRSRIAHMTRIQERWLAVHPLAAK